MNILMTTDTVGGVWHYALELIRHLAPLDVSVALATLGAPLAPQQRMAARQCPNLTIFESAYKLAWMNDPWHDVAAAGHWLRAVAAEVQPDLIHFNHYEHAALPWSAPTLVVGHSCVLSWWQAVKSDFPPAEWNRYRATVARCVRAADLVVAPTRAMLTSMQRNYGPLPATQVISNGRNAQQYAAATKEPMILTAGRLWDEAKNTAALAQVAPRLPWPVYVAGEQQHPSYGSIAAFDHAVLDTLQQQYGAPRARPLYCAVDPDLYFPEAAAPHQHDLGYMGTYSADRQPRLETLLLEPARRWSAGQFIVAGPQYPANVVWPPNVERMMHLSPAQHRPFYTTQRFTLNITRADMIQAGYSPGVRLFEAAACGTPIISDYWEALEIFFDLDTEICVAHSTAEVLHVLHALPEDERQAMGMRARQRVLAAHTAAHRAAELEGYVAECWQTGSTRPPGNGYRSHAAARATPERSV